MLTSPNDATDSALTSPTVTAFGSFQPMHPSPRAENVFDENGVLVATRAQHREQLKVINVA